MKLRHEIQAVKNYQAFKNCQACKNDQALQIQAVINKFYLLLLFASYLRHSKLFAVPSSIPPITACFRPPSTITIFSYRRFHPVNVPVGSGVNTGVVGLGAI